LLINKPNPTTNAPIPYADVFNTQDLYPAISVKKYLDKIVSGAGFTYVSDFLTSQWFKQLIVPYGVSGVPYLTNDVIQSSLYYIGLSGGVQDIADGTIQRLNLGKNTPLPYFDGGNYNEASYRWNVTITATYNIQVRVNVFNFIPISPFAPFAYDQTMRVYLRKNGSTDTKIIEYTWIGSDGRLEKQLSGVLQMPLVNGDYIEVWADYSVDSPTPISPPPYIRFYTDGTYWLNQFSGTPLMQPGFNWTMNETIVPKVKQSDFLMYLVRMFNLFIMPDKDDPKKLYIEPFSDFYDNSTYLDWTSRWDVEKGYEVVPCGYMNPKTYKFNYKDAGGYFEKRYQSAYQSSYGSRTYISSNEFSNGEQSEDVVLGKVSVISVNA